MPDKVGKLDFNIRPLETLRPAPRPRATQVPVAKTEKQTKAARRGDSHGTEEISGTKQEVYAALSPEEMTTLLDTLNEIISIFSVEARYFVDPRTEMQVVQLRDSETKELIRQIPSEEFLTRISRTRDLIGLLFDQKV
ncbi:MAG: hypothetical protein DRG82_15980 [Deltaproteobacteria bacterium]|nr:MAG: hypothetical protein DRG82_15980 [Deltaproteobacteria bacterium]